MASGLSACCLLLLLAGYAAPVPGFLREGTSCWDAVSASAGHCLKARHCQGALSAIWDYRPLPSRCGFVGFDEIVCCTDGHNDGTPQHDGKGHLSPTYSWVKIVDPLDQPPSVAACRDYENNDVLRVRFVLSGKAVRRLELPHMNRITPSLWDEYLLECTTLMQDGSRPYYSFRTSWYFPHLVLNYWSDFYESWYTDSLSSDNNRCRGETSSAVNSCMSQAALGYKLPGTEGVSWLCGGTLISDQFVLTAAHCCSKRLVQVRLGAVDLSSPEVDYDLYGISEIIVHPSYRRRGYHSDIALLKLDRRVRFRLAVFPACLNIEDGDPPSFTAAGWGATNPGGTRFSSTLMKTTIYPFHLSECINFYKEKFPKEKPSSVICAGDPEGKADTCVGDSGGPIVVGEATPYTVVGITSRGPSPCGGNMPSIYTRVSDYIDWIEDHVWPSHD